jgi:YD repeat-containing protein
MTNYVKFMNQTCGTQEMRFAMRPMSGRRVGWLFAVLSIVAATSAWADFGRTAGSGGVAPSGAATYSIPIWVQPGPKGLQPPLAFTYNSHSGNGTMGVGWGVSGFSSIDRCPWTLAEDGEKRAVMMSTTDRFCLDGNKLRVTSGALSSYGSLGAVYQTELADFSRITSVSTAGNGPQSFLVHTKSGQILEYGNTVDSRVSVGSSVYRWLLNKVSDREGNNYTITYTTSNSVGRVPATISWGLTSAGIYQYQATFNYSTKTNAKDFVTTQVNGTTLTNKLRLDSVTIGYSASGSSYVTQRQYALTYVPSSTTLFSRLTQVQECGTSISNCLLPTGFGYQDGAAGVQSNANNVAGNSSATLRGKFDFNGDGRTDIAYFNGSTWRVAFSTGSGFTVGVDTGITATPYAGRYLPSKQDGFLINVGGIWNYVAYNGSSFTTTPTNASAIGVVVPSDYNGDGMQDLVWTSTSGSSGAVKLLLNTTGAGATVPTFAATPSQPLSVNLGAKGGSMQIIPATICPAERMCDINGDGAADLTIQITTTTGCPASGPCTPVTTGYDLVSGGSAYTLVNGTPGSVSPYLGLRFNDDNCMESVRFANSLLRISQCGTGSTSTSVTVPSPVVGAVDWDGDGKTDILVNSSGFIGVYKSTGSLATPLSAVIPTTIPYSSSCTYFGVDVDGDQLDELVCASSTGYTYYSHNGGGSVGSAGGASVFATQIPDLMSSATDGYGLTTSWFYVSTAQSGYTPGTGTAPPLVDVSEPVIVVGRYRISESAGASHDFDYTYKGARRNPSLSDVPAKISHGALTGRSAGFEQVTSVDGRNSVKQRSTYEQVFPLTGMLKTAEVLQSDGTQISVMTNDNQVTELEPAVNNKRYFPHLHQASTDSYEVGTGSLNGQKVTNNTRTLEYTDFTYGNVATDTTVVTDLDSVSTPTQYTKSWTTAVTNAYDTALTSGTDWCVGFLMQVQVAQSSTAAGVGNVTRTVGFSRDTSAPAKCRTKVKTIEPSSSQYKVTETFGFDSYGNVSSSDVVGVQPVVGTYQPMPVRNTTVDWGTTGQFPATIRDPSGATTTFGYYQETGLLKEVLDPNTNAGNVIKSSFVYDEFGRKTRETRPDGTYTTLDYLNCTTNGCANVTHKWTLQVTQHDLAGAAVSDSYQYLDAMDRTLVTRSRLLNGDTWNSTYQWSETDYDAFGRPYHTYMPCTTASATTSCRTNAVTNLYDLVGRLSQSSRPKTQADSSPQTTSYNYSGRTQTVTDAQLQVSTRVLNVDSSVRQILDANNYAINFAYDAAGSLVGVVDSASAPAARLSGVQIDYGIGPLQVAGTDSALGHYTKTYNSLGELIAWTDAKGQSFTATYDSLSRPLSRLEPDSATSTSWEWGADATMHNLGRLRHVENIAAGETYSETYTYDSRGRVQDKTISIPGQGNFSYDFTYEPNKGWVDTLTYPESTPGYRLALKFNYQNGVMQSVSDVNTPSLTYWKANSSDAWGNGSQETLGNGIVTTRAFDAVTGWLASINSGPVGNTTSVQNLSYLYDLVGNVIQRMRPGLTENFYYGGAGSTTDHLYRLEHSILSGSSTNNLALTYDKTGDILTRDEPGMALPTPQSISWTPYNYPATISAAGQNASFSYGPDRQRWRMVFQGGGPDETTYYIGGLFEKVVVGSVTTYRHTILGGGSAAAIYSRSGSTSALRYVLDDNQGSTESFVDGGTGAITNASFTAFGMRRNSATWAGDATNGAALDEITRQGYTYQTVLGSMGMNHMNGRVQDAVTGKFLSADPFVSDPHNTQSFTAMRMC